MSKDSKAPLYEALALAQREWAGKLEADKKGNYGLYTSLGGLYSLVRIPLLDNGLLLRHGAFIDNEGREVELTEIVHRATGEGIVDVRFNKSEKPGNQGRGASSTYMKKYAIKALCAIDTGEDDDDGQDEQDWLDNKVSENDLVLIEKHLDKCEDASTFVQKIYEYYQITQLGELKNKSLRSIWHSLQKLKQT